MGLKWTIDKYEQDVFYWHLNVALSNGLPHSYAVKLAKDAVGALRRYGSVMGRTNVG